MRRFLVFIGVGVVVLIMLGWAVSLYQLKEKKSFSPEDEVIFTQGDLKVKVFYNRPYKKGREIFGKLVPFEKVWRTGANEATTFESNRDLTIQGKVLRQGKYSLWTIPTPGSWTVIFNAEHGQWGINAQGEANRNPEHDVLVVDVMAVVQEKEFEQFTISFNRSGEEAEMVLFWDKTLVAVPFHYKDKRINDKPF